MAQPKVTPAVNVMALPPTTEAFEDNVHHTNIKTVMAASKSEPRAFDPFTVGL